jgi:hypothetical protein
VSQAIAKNLALSEMPDYSLIAFPEEDLKFIK